MQSTFHNRFCTTLKIVAVLSNW